MTKSLVFSLMLPCLTMLAASHAQAWSCKYEKDIDVTLDLSGSDLLEVVAGAGDLEIIGRPGTREARALGRVCASEAEWLDESEILTDGGRTAQIRVSMPDADSGWSITGNRYVYIDLKVEVPENIPLDVRDSSGDMEIVGTASVEVHDSSGDIDIENVTGEVVLNDSSGDIELLDIRGNVTVRQDSSGDIYGRDIFGSVQVERDSSGDIRFRNVRDNYVVERDSSGDIVADSVGGDFRVLSDGSGSIDVRDVAGEVDIPDRG